jgi:uncharacterized iron-regulated protein
MKIIFFLFLTVLYSANTFSQDKSPYLLFNADGKKTTYKKMLKQAKEADIVLFGEFHNNAISHWLQYELTTDLYQKSKLVLGFEMLERDNQDEVNRYLKGEIDQKQLDSLARLWKNYKTDYKPLVDFAKANKIDVCACNVPRYLANNVYKNGFEGLNETTSQEKEWMAPLPILYDASLPGYVEMTKMMGGHAGENLPKAQAIKDATMAYFITKAFKKDHILIHYNGAYHSNNYEGMYWYLKKYNPEFKIMTITTESVKDVKKFEKDYIKKADFIIQVDENMTNTN